MSAPNSQTGAPIPTLLPCPHCGKQPEFYRCGGYDTFQSVIACCGFKHQDFEDAIVKAWNKRVGQPFGPADEVWEVYNRTTSILCATEADADAYLGQFSPAVGMNKTRRYLLRAKNTAPQVPARSADLAKSDPMRQRSGPAEPVSEAGPGRSLQEMADARQDALDAARYRFLRDQANPDDGHPAIRTHDQNSWGKWYYTYDTGENADRKVDEAMASLPDATPGSQG